MGTIKLQHKETNLGRPTLPTDPTHSWPDFMIELEQNILPLYQAHEATFDLWSIHGRLHICRAVIFSEVMGRAYLAAGAAIDFYAVRRAIAFHDSARRGNGRDIWESQSAENCFTYLCARPEFASDPARGRKIANLILKEGDFDLSHRIVYDADVLEIMRPCCGNGGLAGFRREELHFGGRRDPQAGLLDNPSRIKRKPGTGSLAFHRRQRKRKIYINAHAQIHAGFA